MQWHARTAVDAYYYYPCHDFSDWTRRKESCDRSQRSHCINAAYTNKRVHESGPFKTLQTGLVQELCFTALIMQWLDLESQSSYKSSNQNLYCTLLYIKHHEARLGLETIGTHRVPSAYKILWLWTGQKGLAIHVCFTIKRHQFDLSSLSLLISSPSAQICSTCHISTEVS